MSNISKMDVFLIVLAGEQIKPNMKKKNDTIDIPVPKNWL